MNKPYTCHQPNCGTEFDLLPDDLMEMINNGMQQMPEKIKTKCPGCYAAGNTSVDQMIYTVDITQDPPQPI